MKLAASVTIGFLSACTTGVSVQPSQSGGRAGQETTRGGQAGTTSERGGRAGNSSEGGSSGAAGARPRTESCTEFCSCMFQNCADKRKPDCNGAPDWVRERNAAQCLEHCGKIPDSDWLQMAPACQPATPPKTDRECQKAWGERGAGGASTHKDQRRRAGEGGSADAEGRHTCESYCTCLVNHCTDKRTLECGPPPDWVKTMDGCLKECSNLAMEEFTCRSEWCDLRYPPNWDHACQHAWGEGCH